jgi:hypothetical protein
MVKTEVFDQRDPVLISQLHVTLGNNLAGYDFDNIQLCKGSPVRTRVEPTFWQNRLVFFGKLAFYEWSSGRILALRMFNQARDSPGPTFWQNR